MLEITRVQEKEIQKKYCGLCNLKYREEAFAYAAYENDVLLGMAQFKITGNTGEVFDLKNASGIDDLEALILTGKATLNFIDLCGVKDVYIYTEEKKLPDLLGFKKDDNNKLYLNLSGYFENPCKKNHSLS